MNNDKPIPLEGIPVFTGNLATLDVKVTELTSAGETIATATGDVHSSFGGLQAFYKAPEAEQLFATTKPVTDTGRTLKSDLKIIAGALSAYSDEVYPLVEKLKEIKRDAGAFLVKVNADDKWREDGDLIEENNHRRDEIAETLAAFQDAEITCHNKITALVCAVPLKKNDGSDSKHQYGFDADTLKQAEGLPWGDPLVESVPGWQVWEHAWDFTKGFFVDGVWGTIKGLGTLVGFSGWEEAGQAWKGLGQLGTGLVMTVAAGPAYWTAKDEDLPSWLRDSRTAVKETGKALVAWDEWGENPSRAAGAVTFNVITTVFTGGAGGAVAGGGKAALAAKALSTAGKVGRFVDPMTYVFKGAGFGLTKIGNVMTGLKGLGTIEIPPLPDNVFTLPEGAVRLPNGTIDLPAGTAIPEGAIRLADGTVRLPEGAIALPEGTVKNPFDEGAAYADLKGNLYDENGNLVQRAEEARPEPGKTDLDANTPDHTHAEAPARQPVLVGAGVRVGDYTGGVAHSGQGGTFGPSHAVNNGAHGLGREGNHTPGGGAPGGMPRNELDNASRGSRPGDLSPVSRPDGPSAGGSHPDGAGSGHAGGSGHASSTAPPGASPSGPLDEATRATHRTEYEAARDVPASDRTPAESVAITREHVRLANEDPIWRAEHYDKWGPGYRNSAAELVDGQLLPKLVEKPGGGWMAESSIPHAHPGGFHLGTLERGPSTVLPDDLKHLDKVAAKRMAGMELTKWEKLFEKDPSFANAYGLAHAQENFNVLGEGAANNSKLGEALGEEAARRHMLRQVEFEGAHELTDLPETANGSKRFDQLWRDKDGNLLIVEAKSPNGALDWRQSNGHPSGGTFMVKQGSLDYVRTIVADMKDRVLESPGEAKYIREIEDAIKDKTLRYVLVQASENTGTYAGAVLKYFKLF
ncbi:hypothetical protein [Streptomyces sp. NBC_01012]|uniref:hypothetical protein n=1 Tax=Streptomyces sp. NBC_01012 TaxID=2903717 RepID=UPI00386F78CD|nr:hypothetical protein OG623_22965 [Streptomyces sp. NBC_01012]